MLYELLFGYEDGGDEWTEAEGYDIRDIVIEFFHSVKPCLLLGQRRTKR